MSLRHLRRHSLLRRPQGALHLSPSPSLQRQIPFLTAHGSTYDYAFFPPSGQAIGLVLPRAQRDEARTIRTSLLVRAEQALSPAMAESTSLGAVTKAWPWQFAKMLANSKEMRAFERNPGKRTHLCRAQLGKEYEVDTNVAEVVFLM